MRRLYWFNNMLWSLGGFYLSLLRFDMNDARLYWNGVPVCIRMIFRKKVSHYSNYGTLPIKKQLKNILIMNFGGVVTTLIITGLCSMCLEALLYTLMFSAFLIACIRIYCKTK